MDRQIVYTGALPQSVDILNTNKMAQIGLAYAMRGILGTNTVIHDLPCTPTSPASLQVVVGVGGIYTLDVTDAAAYGDLGVDQHQIVKQGLLQDPLTLSITPPVTPGQSQVYLVQAILSDVDAGATVFPYYNATNPAAPFSGPGNNGMSQFSTRTVKCTVALKAGIAAATGSQATPAPDLGYTGIYAITVVNGQTQITTVNIVRQTTAPFFPTLPAVPNSVQTSAWTYCVDTGTTNAMVATIYPPITTLVAGTAVLVKAAAGNTGAATFNLNGTGNQPVHRANGAALSSGDYNTNEVLALVWDGIAWQVVNFFGFTSSTTNNNTFTISIPYCVDTGVANAIVANFSPVIASLAAGLLILVKIAAQNTGATTISVNGLTQVALVRTDLGPLINKDIGTGEVALMVYDGTRFQLISFPANLPRLLSAPMTLYVNANTGNDTNDGLTPGTPFLTIQRALTVMNTYTNIGFQFTISVADGTYPPFIAPTINGTGTCQIIGNQTLPANCIINDTVPSAGSAACIIVGVNYLVTGLKFQSLAGFGFEVTVGSAKLWNVEFGNCGTAHMGCSYGGLLQKWGTNSFIRVSGSAQYHEFIDTKGIVTTDGTISLQILTPITVNIWTLAVAGAYVNDNYVLGISNPTYVTAGTKFAASQNAIIDTRGQGVSYLPGTLPGYTQSGGQYT